MADPADKRALTLRSGVIGVGLLIAAPGAMGGALVLAPLVGLMGPLAAPWGRIRESARRAGLPLLLFLAWIGWATASVLWTPGNDPRTAWRLIGGALTGLLLVAAFARPPERADSALIRKAIVAFAALTALLGLIEWYGGMPLNRLGHSGPQVGDWGGPTTFLARAPMMGSAVLVAAVWPAIALLWRWGLRGRIAAGVLLAATLAICARSTVDAAILAFVLGMSGLAAGAMFGAIALRICGALLAAWLVLNPFLTSALAGILRDGSVPTSWATRLDVWRATIDKIAAHPLFGAGVGSFRKLSQPMITAEGPLQPLHPHNASLQAWFELGFVGAALGAAALVALTEAGARALRGKTSATASACACLLAAGAIANVSYGLWEEWWVATLFLAGGMVAATRAKANRASPAPPARPLRR